MKTFALLAVGALALSACDFAGSGPEMSDLGINRIAVSDLPAAAFNDAGGTADVFIEIQNHAGQTVWRSRTFTAATPDQAFDVRLSEAVMVASRTQDLTVAVWDFDGSLYDSQLIARSVTFKPADVTPQPMALAARTGAGSFTLNAAQ